MGQLASLLGSLGTKLEAIGATKAMAGTKQLVPPSMNMASLSAGGASLGGVQTQPQQGGANPGSVTSASPFSAIGGAANSAGNAVISSGNPYAAAAGAVLKFVGTLMESVDKIRNWGNSLHEANMQFADFSSSMAAVQAQSEQRDFYLKQSQGESRAASADFLAKGKGGLDQTMAPLENLWAKVENYVGGTVLVALDVLVKPVSIIAEWLGGAGEVPNDFNAFLYDLGQEAIEAQKRRPERMR